MKPAYRYAAELHRVIDGDTVDLAVDLGFRTWAHLRFRLEGINAPEMSGPTRQMGIKARLHLEWWLTDNPLTVESTGEFGKYGGTWMGRIFAGVIDVNQRMIDDGYAMAYDGKSPRRTWDPNAAYPLPREAR